MSVVLRKENKMCNYSVRLIIVHYINYTKCCAYPNQQKLDKGIFPHLCSSCDTRTKDERAMKMQKPAIISQPSTVYGNSSPKCGLRCSARLKHKDLHFYNSTLYNKSSVHFICV